MFKKIIIILISTGMILSMPPAGFGPHPDIDSEEFANAMKEFAKMMENAFQSEEFQQELERLNQAAEEQVVDTEPQLPPQPKLKIEGTVFSKKRTQVEEELEEKPQDFKSLFINGIKEPAPNPKGSPQKEKIAFSKSNRNAFVYYKQKFLEALQNTEKTVGAFKNFPINSLFTPLYLEKDFVILQKNINRCVIALEEIAFKKGYILVFLTEHFINLRKLIVELTDQIERYNSKIELLLEDQTIDETSHLQSLAQASFSKKSTFDSSSDDNGEDLDLDNSLTKPTRPKSMLDFSGFFNKTQKKASVKKSRIIKMPQESPQQVELNRHFKNLERIAKELEDCLTGKTIADIIEKKKSTRGQIDKDATAKIAARKGKPLITTVGSNDRYSSYTPKPNYYTPSQGYNRYSSDNGGYYNYSPYQQQKQNNSYGLDESSYPDFNKSTSQNAEKSEIFSEDAESSNQKLEIFIQTIQSSIDQLVQKTGNDLEESLKELLSSSYFSNLNWLYDEVRKEDLSISSSESSSKKELSKKNTLKVISPRQLNVAKKLLPYLLQAMTIELDEYEDELNQEQIQAKKLAKDFILMTLRISKEEALFNTCVRDRVFLLLQKYRAEFVKLQASTKSNKKVKLNDLSQLVKQTGRKFLQMPKEFQKLIKEIDEEAAV